VGPENFVTGQVEAAIPSVAVTSDGTVGVSYNTKVASDAGAASKRRAKNQLSVSGQLTGWN